VLKPYCQINFGDNTLQDYLIVGLAPDYNNLDRKSIKMLDDNLKVMIAGTVKATAMIPPSERSWDRIVSAMMQCPLIEPAGVAVQRTDSLVKSGTDVVKFDGSPDSAIVGEVRGYPRSFVFTIHGPSEPVFGSYNANGSRCVAGPILVLQARRRRGCSEFDTVRYRGSRQYGRPDWRDH
jgi:hypothetical protein